MASRSYGAQVTAASLDVDRSRGRHVLMNRPPLDTRILPRRRKRILRRHAVRAAGTAAEA